jgi:hypothetical protein
MNHDHQYRYISLWSISPAKLDLTEARQRLGLDQSAQADRRHVPNSSLSTKVQFFQVIKAGNYNLVNRMLADQP